MADEAKNLTPEELAELRKLFGVEVVGEKPRTACLSEPLRASHSPKKRGVK